MSAPKPHDPRATGISPDQLTAQFEEILAQPTHSLADEAEVLGQAHTLLNEALQER
ncbi:hypothetical protein [Corynebacterium lubricantis]|uniref:hypothetical protein n=1 Tax=Corynebacterium lubricantis TaxID=541095 RepID=UPI0003640FF5|nr:hypothetical protein [Corynebacterium lubricantis]